MAGVIKDDDFFAAVTKIVDERIPFNKQLGLKVESINYERVKISIPMRHELTGHYRMGVLHGGVISSVMDMAGGLSAFLGVHQKKKSSSPEEAFERFDKVSSIDIRIDFLRPGVGEWFVATAYLLRVGKKIAVARIELHNDQNKLIAVGTGSYVVA